MTPAELGKWLDTDESKSVGQKSGNGGESTGHQTGRHIVEILDTKKWELSDRDYSHMRTVVAYTPNAISRNARRVTSNTPHGVTRC